jgi:hypothetical protein
MGVRFSPGVLDDTEPGHMRVRVPPGAHSRLLRRQQGQYALSDEVEMLERALVADARYPIPEYDFVIRGARTNFA